MQLELLARNGSSPYLSPRSAGILSSKHDPDRVNPPVRAHAAPMVTLRVPNDDPSSPAAEFSEFYAHRGRTMQSPAESFCSAALYIRPSSF